MFGMIVYISIANAHTDYLFLYTSEIIEFGKYQFTHINL